MQNLMLIAASGKGDLQTVHRLLDDGADPDAVDCTGWTALHLAAAMGHVDVIRALIARGADIAARNKAGETPLHLAVMLGQTAAVDTLLESGDPRVLEAATDVGWTPLDYARLDQHPALGDQLRKSVRD